MSSLKLSITKGPRNGETLEFPPGATVNIGRTSRGNSLHFSDSGVSSKHLSISSGSHGTWLLRDLNSSNGTFLNGEPIDPFLDVELSDGDCVKIGETTSFCVSIVKAFAESGGLGLRRNPRRRANLRVKIDEDDDLVEDSAVAENRRPATRNRRVKNDEGGDCVSVELVEDSAAEKPRRGGLKKKPVKRQGDTRQRNRRLKNDGEDENVSDGLVLEEIPEDSEVVVAVGEAKVLEAKKKPARRTNRRLKNGGDGEVSAGSGLEKVLEGSRKGKNPEPENGDRIGVEEDRIEEGVAREVEERSVGGSVSKEVDLEKMTLGEWFDFLEADLPKQIIEATEDIIKGMSLKAQRVREYAAQQKKGKGAASVV